MRPSSIARCFLAALAAAVPLADGVSQTFVAITGADAVIEAPVSGGARVNVPGHRRHAEEKLLYGHVRDGVYTVDGMVAKVQLNYDVNGVKFLYLFAPGVGTAVISAAADQDAVMASASYSNGELSFSVGEHRFNLTGIALASDKGIAPAHLYVKLDRTAWRLNRRPMLGFGNATALPYQWPGALPSTALSQTEEPQTVPPVPANLLPSATTVVPAVQTSADADVSRPVTLR